MIFLTIGTHEPFDRLVKAVDSWLDTCRTRHDVIAQVVSPPKDAYNPHNFGIVAHLAPSDYERHIKSCDLIVSHAGMGTILMAFTFGKPVVIMPRRGHLRETRNDHQFTTVKALARRPGLFVAQDETELPSVMDEALASMTSVTPPRLSDVADAAFTNSLRDFILSGKRN